MVGSGLAIPRRLAAKRWRQAGAKETRSVSARRGCPLTHAFADHSLRSTEEETRTRRQQLELSHQQPPLVRVPSEAPSIPPASSEHPHPRLCSNIISPTPRFSRAGAPREQPAQPRRAQPHGLVSTRPREPTTRKRPAADKTPAQCTKHLANPSCSPQNKNFRETHRSFTQG